MVESSILSEPTISTAVLPSTPAPGRIVALAALLGAGLVLYASRRGPGLSPDSLEYLLLARGLARWEGFGWLGHPTSHFPPGYPALLALVGAVDPSSLGRAAALHALLFAANVVLFARLCAAAAGNARAGAVGAALVVVSPPIVALHAMAWSEPLFLAAVFGAMLLAPIGRHGERGPARAIATGACLAAAILTRYAGLAIVPPILLAILWRGGRPRRSEAALVATVALAPFLAWLVRNARVAGSTTDRALAWHPPGLGHLDQLLRTAGELAGLGSSPIGGAVTLGALGALTIVVRGRRDTAGHEEDGARLRLCAIAAVAYGAALGLSLALFDADTPLDSRILAPLYFLLLILVVRALVRGPTWTMGRAALGASLAIVFVAGAVRTSAFVREWHENGEGFARRYWRHSPTLAYAAAFPRRTRVYTNAPELIAFETAHETRDVPQRHARTSLRPRPEYEAEQAALCADVLSARAVLLYLDGVSWRWQVPAGEDLAAACGLPTLERFEDGAIYGAAPG